jgi:hypothetical protein
MTGESGDLVGHFRAGVDVVRRYPILIAPPLAVQVIVFVLALLFLGGGFGIGMLLGGAMGGMPAGAAGGVVGMMAGGLLLMVLSGFLSLVASSVVVVMARDALTSRPPTFGPALDVALGRLFDVLVASFLLMVIIGIGMVLLVLPGLVAAFFLIFTLPAVLLDGKSATAALGHSARLVRANLGTVAGLFFGGLVVAVVTAIVSRILEIVPLLGHLAAAVLAGAFISYLTVVGVRVYQGLRGA